MSSDAPRAVSPQRHTENLSKCGRACVFSVHIFTALGAALGLLALMAAVERNWAGMFWWFGAALAVDALDGPLARRLKVAERLPQWSGESLDFVIDYVTYVFVPAYAIAASGLLPAATAVPLGVLIATSGALYFADLRMKMEGNYFRGFPVLWNAAAFYLFLLRPSPWIGAAGAAILLLLTFVPFRFIHPVRVARWRYLNMALLILWALFGAAALLQNLDPVPWITACLCAIGVYFLAAGLLPRPSGGQSDA